MYNMQTSMRLGGGRVDEQYCQPFTSGFFSRKWLRSTVHCEDSKGNCVRLGREYAKSKLSVDFNREFTFKCFQPTECGSTRKHWGVFGRKISERCFSYFNNNCCSIANEFKKSAINLKLFLCDKCFVHFNERFLLCSLRLTRNEVVA